LKRLLIIVSAALAFPAANAADMAPHSYTKAAPMVSPLYNWSGFYVGAKGGYGWSDTGVDLKEGFGGRTVGYNWQMSNMSSILRAKVLGPISIRLWVRAL
jgi:outer membrane immunogenic protein